MDRTREVVRWTGNGAARPLSNHQRRGLAPSPIHGGSRSSFSIGGSRPPRSRRRTRRPTASNGDAGHRDCTAAVWQGVHNGALDSRRDLAGGRATAAQIRSAASSPDSSSDDAPHPPEHRRCGPTPPRPTTALPRALPERRRRGHREVHGEAATSTQLPQEFLQELI